MIFSQSCPNYFPFLLSSLPLKLHFGHFPLFFSFYIQLSVPFHVFLLRAPCLLDIFLFFLQYMSNFPFHFMSSFSEYPVFWIFSFSFFNICPTFRSISCLPSPSAVFWIFPLFFFNICPIFTSISCLPSPSALSFGYFPYFSSIYIQFSTVLQPFSFPLLSIIIKFGYIAIRNALYVQSISVNT